MKKYTQNFYFARYRFLLILSLAVTTAVFSLLSSGAAQAQTADKTFGPCLIFTESHWHNSTCWSPPGVPTVSQSVLIPSGATARILNAGVVHNAAIINQGTLVIQPGLSLTLGSSGSLNNFGVVQNFGALNNSGSFLMNNGSSFINNGQFTNNSGGLFTSTGGVTTNFGSMNNFGSFNQNGTLNNNSVISIFSGAFSNGGTLNSFGGTISNFAGAFNNSGGTLNNFGGSMNISAAASLNNFSGLINNNSGSIINSGTVLNSVGTISNNGGSITNFLGGTFTQAAGGRLNNSGGGSFNNEFGGVMNNGGLVNNNTGGAFNNAFGAILNAISGGTFNNTGGTLNNNGNIGVFGAFNNNGGGLINNNATAGINISGGVLTNGVGGTIQNKLGATIANNNTFANLGGATTFNSGLIANNAVISNPGVIINDCTGVISGFGLILINQPLINCNNPPTALADAYTLTEDAPLIVPAPGILANDHDFDQGDSVSVITQNVLSAKGILVQIQFNGAFTYNPQNLFNGLKQGQIDRDTFDYTISDEDGEHASATVALTIMGVNDPPSANNDAYAILEDTPTLLNVLLNDTDPDGDPLTIISVENFVNGTPTVQSNQVLFTPAPDFNGMASFTYTISDGIATDTAMVTVTVTGVDDPPNPPPPDPCPTPDPAADLSGLLLSDSMGQITNVSTICSYEVGMASYRKMDNIIDNQVLYDWTDPTFIKPGETITLNVALPDCAAQVDLFWGSVLLSLNGQRYGPRLLAGRMIGGTNYCTETDPFVGPGPIQNVTASAAYVEPTLPPCAVQDNAPNSAFRVRMLNSGIRSNEAICRVIAENGTLYLPGAIGVQGVIDQGVIQAIDVFGVDPGVGGEIEVCLLGNGGILYLDANGTPRIPQWMATVQRDGYTCAVIPHAGTVVLVQTNEFGGVSHVAPDAPPAEIVELSGCQVTTLQILNLRPEPTTASERILVLPDNVTLNATARAGAWMRVRFGDAEGWAHGDYLRFDGACG